MGVMGKADKLEFASLTPAKGRVRGVSKNSAEARRKILESATLIMLKIHHEGRGVCGVYTKDVAATKVELVLAAARRAGHPLQCIMEAA